MWSMWEGLPSESDFGPAHKDTPGSCKVKIFQLKFTVESVHAIRVTNS